MITILRKHHQWLMIIIAILSIPFVFYFVQKPDYGALFHQDDLGRIYDRPVTLVEYSRTARLLTLASRLGLTLPNDLMTTNVKSENEMYAEFTWNRLVLRHEAEELGIRPDSTEITDFVKTLSAFNSDGGFDIGKYTEFTKETLPSLGFNETQIEEVVSDQLSLNRMRDMLGGAAQVPESENKENYERAYGKMYVATVHLQDEDFKKGVKITDDEISKYFDAHKEQLKSDEKRKIEFVSFTLTDPEKKLTGKDRVEALQKVADKANDFSQALLEKDAKFTEVAAKLNIPVVATEEFTAAKPAPQFAGNPQLTQYAFQLTPENPVSDSVQGPDGFYVLHLLGTTESKPLDLEGAKAKIVETLSAERLHQMVSGKGSEIAQKLREALKAGTPLDQAIARSKLKLSPWWPAELAARFGLNSAQEPSGLVLEKFPPFTLAETSSNPETEMGLDNYVMPTLPSQTPDLPTIRSTVASLQPGEVSDFVAVADGGFVIALEKRDPADPAGYAAAKAKFETGNIAQRRKAVFVEWMRDRRKAARVTGATG